LIAISPPIDIYSSIVLLSQNKVYERYFMHALKLDVEYRHEVFEDLPPIDIPSSMSLAEFNEFYIAPQAGFSNVVDYYHACSSGRLIPCIQVPSYILFSRDDPIVDCSIFDTVKYPDNVKILITENGGHLGYLGTPRKYGGFLWMDFVLYKWIFENR
jgi:uncharacterized protein